MSPQQAQVFDPRYQANATVCGDFSKFRGIN